MEDASLAFKEGVKSTIDDLKEINLGTLDNSCLVYISALFTFEKKKYILSYCLNTRISLLGAIKKCLG